MSHLGYRIRSRHFHPNPWNEDQSVRNVVELPRKLPSPNREGDDYGSWLARGASIPALIPRATMRGKRTEMFYLRNTPARFPTNLGGDWWAADRTIDGNLQVGFGPFFGFVSFIGRIRQLAPPLPFKRRYNFPDRLPELSTATRGRSS